MNTISMKSRTTAFVFAAVLAATPVIASAQHRGGGGGGARSGGSHGSSGGGSRSGSGSFHSYGSSSFGSRGSFGSRTPSYGGGSHGSFGGSTGSFHSGNLGGFVGRNNFGGEGAHRGNFGGYVGRSGYGGFHGEGFRGGGFRGDRYHGGFYGPHFGFAFAYDPFYYSPWDWPNIAVGIGCVGAIATLEDDDCLVFPGDYGALYPYSTYEVDLVSPVPRLRLRAEYFSHPYFYRDGVRFDREVVTRGGERFYRFARH